MTWKNFTLHNDSICLKICFGDKVKRIDIRAIINNLPSKYGVSLTAAEFKFLVKYYKKFNESPLEARYFKIAVRKYSNKSIEIVKNGSKVITPLSFWDKISSLVPLTIYLVSEEIAVNQLIDLYILSFYLDVEQILTRQWGPGLCFSCDPDNSIVYQLGLAEEKEFKNRKIDTGSLDLFIGSNKEVSSSLVAFMYK